MNIINKIFSSKNTLLEMLELRNYDIEKYKNFSLNEIDAMYKAMEKKMTTESSPLDFDCEKGMNWLDQFYANFYDSKQEQNLASDLNGEDLTEDEKSLVKRHRMGVFGMIGLFSMAVFMIDSNIQ